MQALPSASLRRLIALTKDINLGGLFRSLAAQLWELRAEMGVCAHESCASATEQNSRRLAVPRRNCSDSICM